MSDSDSEVDFDIEVPTDTRKIRKGKSPKAVPNKRGRPLLPSNDNDDDSDSSPERIPRKVNKRPADAEWDASSSSSSNEFHDALNDTGEGIGNGGRSPSSTENEPPIGGRPKSKRINLNESHEGDDSNDELLVENLDGQGKKAGRSRKRLSLRPNGNGSSMGGGLNSSRAGSTISVTVSTAGGPPPDPQTLRKIYSTCIEMFQSHKITLDNAFQLRFLDLMGDIIEMPDFDKNDMHGAGRVLEAGARIYVCRVDKTKSSVMDLASTLNLQKKKKKQGNEIEMDGEPEEDNEMGDGDGEEARPKKVKKKRKLKENRNVAEDETKISADLEDHSSKAATRREGLKKKFNDLVDDDLDFEFNRYFFSSKDQDPVTKPEELEAYTQVTTVSDAIINHVEIRSLEFIPFALVPVFDSAVLNIWGLPIDPAAVHTENGDLSLAVLPDQEPIPPADDLAYNPDERPVDYGPEDLEDHNNGNDTFVNEDGEEVNTEGRPVIDPRKVRSLAEFYDMFLKIKSKYGWCGPTFVRPQFLQRNANPNQKKPKQKKEPITVEYKMAEWNSEDNKYETENPEKSVFDERTIEKWSYGGKHVQPYIGIEGSDEECDDGFDILIAEEKQNTENFIPSLFKYFLDPNRNLLESLQRMVKDDEDSEPHQFHKEEEDYIHDAGFDIERHRDMDDFAADRDGQDDDIPLNFDTQAPFEASFAFPVSLGGVLMDTDGDPLSKATDVDSIKFTKKPKPIDMHALKRSILHFLRDKLVLESDGRPSHDEETITNLATLVKEVCQTVDKKMAEHLSISIIVVGLMHVVVDKKLFMMPNKTDPSNPLIICRGKLWKHSEHIPLPKDFNIFANDRNNSNS